MTPGHDDDAATRRTHPRQLLDKLLLVRHVLAAFQAPHQVKGRVLKGLLQRIRHLVLGLRANTCCDIVR